MVNKKKGDAKELRDRAKKKKSDDHNKGESGVILSMVMFFALVESFIMHSIYSIHEHCLISYLGYQSQYESFSKSDEEILGVSLFDLIWKHISMSKH